MTKRIDMNSILSQEKQYFLQKMVEEIDKRFPLEEKIKQAFLAVDREEFVPQIFKHLAYSLDALPMQKDQWISSPLTVAKMTQYLEPKGAKSVLEIGCGSGYQAAILSQLFEKVYTIERIESLLNEARARFRKLNIKNILTKFDDGLFGWEAFAPFDRILFSASPEQIPQRLFEQLKEGGMLLAPVNEYGLQTLTRFRKRRGQIITEMIEQCNFVPVVRGRAY